jgi:signal transduction histidine kinase
MTLPAWAVADGPAGIRAVDVGIVVVVVVAVELNVAVGNGPGAAALNLAAYLLGALLAVPILFRRRWPFRVLLASTALMVLFYIVHRRNISPAPALVVPIYDAAVAGYLALSIAVPTFFMVTGLVIVELSTRESLVTLSTDFMPQFVALTLAVMLGEVIRGRRALAVETAQRLRIAEEERTAETGRQVAEERLRIARELHDTVAHSLATITVQAGSALHILAAQSSAVPSSAVPSSAVPSSAVPSSAVPAGMTEALTGIRETSKSALIEMRSVLGQLRSGSGTAGPGSAVLGSVTGLERLPALRDAVSAAGTPVTVVVEGAPVELPAAVDHAAYRILQESLTNVLRHAGPGAAATVCLRYGAGELALTVIDDGAGVVGEGDEGGNGNSVGDGGGHGGGHGVSGMLERAVSVGGTLTTGPGGDAGFQVCATLPIGEVP